MKRPAHVQSFLDSHAGIARYIRTGWGIAPSVTLAQSGWESGWGRKSLCKHGVWFGETAGHGAPGTITVQVEGRPWTYRTYPDYTAAARGYARLLETHKAYASAWPYRGNPEEYLPRIGKAYSGSPKYAGLLIAMIRDFALTEFDQASFQDLFIIGPL